MTRTEVLDRLKVLKPALEREGVRRIRLYGSHARNDATATSDVDLLLDFHEQPSLLELIALESRIADALGAPVDVATEAGLRPRVRARIEAEAVDA